jgi:hypothetical protein
VPTRTFGTSCRANLKLRHYRRDKGKTRWRLGAGYRRARLSALAGGRAFESGVGVDAASSLASAAGRGAGAQGYRSPSMTPRIAAVTAASSSSGRSVVGTAQSFPDQRFLIKLELQLGVLAPRFFDAIAERPTTSRRSRHSPVRREGSLQTPHELLALALELLKLRLSRPPPDLRGDGR